jgi:membrane-associated phospholipid phosphatase
MGGRADRSLPVVASAVLVASAALARTRRVTSAESALFRRFNRAPDAIRGPVWVLMQSGALGAVGVAAALTARRSGVTAGVSVLAAGAGAWGGVKAVKPLVGRCRPAAYLDGVVVRGAVQRGLGYPSGHAAVACALSLTVATRRCSRTAASAVAMVAGCARMYTGAHLPLDVVGGAAIGVLAAGCARRRFGVRP